MERRLDFKQTEEKDRPAAWRRLIFNKWSLTFGVMLIMLSVYMGTGQAEKTQQTGGVLYVTDTLPYDVQKVSGDGSVEVVQAEDKPLQKEENRADKPEVDKADLDARLNAAGEFSINSDSDFFINYRLEREKARSRQLELLQGLIDDESTSAEIRAESQQRIIAQAEAIEQELMLESILVAKYGGEAAVFIRPEKANVVLSLNSEKMSNTEAEKIAALVDNYTGIGYENIVVVLKD